MALNRTVTLGFLVLFACGRPEEAAPPTQRSALQASFEAAARELQVPVALLESIAYVETRVSPTAGLVSQSGGHGIMAIVERPDWQMLSRATALTGASAGRLDVDANANIRGGAAVLRELADETFRENAALDPNRLGDWYQAVTLYPGIDSATLAQDWAAQVFTSMERGFVVPELNLEPTASSWRDHAPAQLARRDALNGTDYPAAVGFISTPNMYTGRTSYEFVVIHTMQGSYSGTISWIQNPASQVSANYVVRSSDGQITQMVHDADSAWHAQCYNKRSIGIEHEGYVADPARWYTEAMYSESAKMTRWLCDHHGIPRDRTHIIGHVEVAPSCNTGGHTDPGSGWNWTHYMDLVNNAVPTPTTGVVTGLIYTGGNSANRVAGATVSVAGHTMTTGTDGLYTFTLAPGSYTVTVTKSGFGSNMVTRSVTAGGTIWGSMEINPVAATGTLSGTVFAFNPANPADMSTVIAGAAISVSPGGATATTGADGKFSLTLAPGTVTVTAAMAGYATNAQSSMVVAGQTVTANIGLSSTSGPDLQPPSVTIAAPMNDAQLDVAVVDLQGAASDDRGAVSSVTLSMNGAAATDVPVNSGAFNVQVKLKPGLNTLHVTAVDAAGNMGSADVTATFNAGIAGYVFADMDETKRVAGATLELFVPSTGVSVTSATADGDGAFVLGVTDAPADYKVVVKAAGYHTHVETVTVGDDKRLALNVSLLTGMDQTPGDLLLAFSEPQEGATLNTGTVTVYGSVSGFELLSIKVNGVQGETLGNGGFSATVPLTEGANTLLAEATGINGEKVSGVLHVTRKAPDDMKAKGGCSATGGLELFALAALAGLLRRRRSCR